MNSTSIDLNFRALLRVKNVTLACAKNPAKRFLVLLSIWPKINYYFFELNRFSCNLLCASFTRRIAHMQKGTFQNIQEPFQKKQLRFYFFTWRSREAAINRSRVSATSEWNHGPSVPTFFSRLPPRCNWPFAAAVRWPARDPSPWTQMPRASRIPVSVRMNFLISWQMRLEVGHTFV